MKIFGYIISNPDEVPVLPDALDSLASFCDRIFLVDGGLGGGTLNHGPEHFTPLKDVMYDWVAVCQWFTHRDIPNGLERTGVWGNKYVPITLWEHSFADPASQRNWTLDRIWNYSEQCDWLVMLDSDEVYSYEAELGMRDYLAQVPDDIIGVYQKWLNLVQDEQHCVGGHHSDWLAHPRIMRPKTFYWGGSWHEPMVCDRNKLIRWDTRVIHSRALFRRRLLVQRGHATIRERSTINPDLGPFWDDAVMEPIPAGVTWRPLHWPVEEIAIDFNTDALTIWNERGELRSKEQG